jgi:hypothetical protein
MILQEKYDLVDELLHILEKLIAIYTNYLALSNDKQSVLTSGTPQDLQIIAQHEKEMAAVIEKLEQRRITLQYEIDASHSSINDLILELEEPRKSQAISLAHELRQLVKSLRVIQDGDSIVLHNFLKLVRHKRNVLFKVSTVPDYGDNNNFTNNKSIINKII